VKPDLHIERWAIERLIPYARNPRTHTEEQVAQIAASIAEFGFVNPVLVGADGVIIAGAGSTRSPWNEEQWRREVARCEREMAEAEALLRAGHPDVAGLCLALHDWAQELRTLEWEREQWMSGS